ncbi:MAG: ABC transporter permease [Azospirillaceae bacterium]
MLRYLVQRLMATIPVMGVVAIIVFGLIHLSPTDPAAVIAGDYATPAHVAEIREQLQLDRPIPEQFLAWIGQVLSGDLGDSIFSERPVLQLIMARLEPTVSLALMTILVAVTIAVPIGVVAAWQARTLLDRALMLLATLGISVPAFWIGYLLIFSVALDLGWLPVQGYASLSEGLWPFLSHLILPSVTLGTAYAALIARITRASMLEVLGQDFIRTARAKGLPMRKVLIGHALRAAAIPIVTVIGLGFALLIGGVVITESVFAIPGIGRLTVDSIQRKDIPVIQGVLLVFSAVYVIVNLLVDLLYTLLDPRIRYAA